METVSKEAVERSRLLSDARAHGFEITSTTGGGYRIVRRRAGSKRVLRGIQIYPNGTAVDLTVPLEVQRGMRSHRAMRDCLHLPLEGTVAAAIDSMTRGPQKIRQRWKSCTCGCRGRDPWHVTWIKRCVRDVTPVENPAEGVGYHTIARGTYRHPSGEQRPCYLDVFRFEDGTWASSGTWVWNDAKWG